jgi:hypothetical protein
VNASTPTIDEAAVRRFVTLLHERARHALRGQRGADAVLIQLCRLHPDAKGMSTTAYKIGEAERMADDAIMHAKSGQNVYTELRVVQGGTPGERGTASATAGVFGFGIDRDADTGRAGTSLNGAATVTIETSSHNVQELILLDRALPPDEAHKIGAAIRAATRADYCSGTITQPYRIPGLPNFPNAAKRARGRTVAATRLLQADGKVWTRDELLAAFPSEAPRAPAAKKTPTRPVKSSMRVRAKASRKATPKMDRSATFQSTVAAAVKSGMTADELEHELRKHPDGCASKYLEGTDRLRAEIDRSWQKAEAAREAKRGPAVEPDPDADGAQLLNDVAAFLDRFIVHPSPHALAAHTLWIAHAHLMDSWDSTPRLAFLSPEPESGKTRALEITELLVPRPVASFNVSPAYLVRKIADEAGRPTILFDEVDTVFKDGGEGREDLRALLNAGYRRGATVGRCVVAGKAVEPEDLPAYAAVALAGLGHLPDTVASRSIIVHMQRRAPDEAVESFRQRKHTPEGHALRDRLAAWAAGIAPQITGGEPAMPDGVTDRCADVWEPLLLLADTVGEKWPEMARCCAVAFVAALRGEREGALGTRLLADVREVFKEGEESLSTERLLTRLRELPESPWADLRGKPLTDRGLATRLRPYGIRSKGIRVGDKTPKGYARADFHEAWRRYLSPSP